MVAHQRSGPSLLAAAGPVNRPARLEGGAKDPDGDATFDAAGVVGANQPNLDLVGSSIAKTTDGYRVTMQVTTLADLTPGPAAGGTTLVWSTQWKVVSAEAPNGGATFHAYMESVAGGA